MKILCMLFSIGALVVVAACNSPAPPVAKMTPTPTPGVVTPAPSGLTPTPVGNPSIYPWGTRSKTSGCVYLAGPRPDANCSPGAIFANASKDVICVPGYASRVRNVPASEAAAVYAEYGISSHSPGQYEDDHLVPLELGGSNDIANLWPESGASPNSFHEKDALENRLHELVCSGKLALQVAQFQIASDWITAYSMYVTPRG